MEAKEVERRQNEGGARVTALNATLNYVYINSHPVIEPYMAQIDFHSWTDKLPLGQWLMACPRPTWPHVQNPLLFARAGLAFVSSLFPDQASHPDRVDSCLLVLCMYWIIMPNIVS